MTKLVKPTPCYGWLSMPSVGSAKPPAVTLSMESRVTVVENRGIMLDSVEGVRSAAVGGIFPDLFIRRVADDIELSWSGLPMSFTQDGLAIESGTGQARLPVREVAQTIWQMLNWAVGHPPESPARYQDRIAALRTKVESLRSLEYPTLARAHVSPIVWEKAESARRRKQKDHASRQRWTTTETKA